MTADGATPTPAGKGQRNLLMRILAAAVLIPLALVTLWAGGWIWTLLVTLAAVGLFVEWLMVAGAVADRRALGAGLVALIVAGLCLGRGLPVISAAVLAAGTVLAGLFASGRRIWVVLGVLYAAAAEWASLVLRSDSTHGFAALLLVFLVVWGADIGGYGFGRTLGGPKLWPRISPNKTWAGAIGGFAISIIAAGVFAAIAGYRVAPLMLVAAVLSVVSQAGDLMESAVKRHFGVKDSSQLIPGHGGLLDRLDGFVAAVAVAVIFGLLRGGIDGAGAGLVVW